MATKYTDEQKEHIRHCFNYYCKNTMRYQAISLYRENAKYVEHNVSFEEILNDYFSECGECDTYPILQYHFEAFGYHFSVNDYKLGNALLQLPKKKRDVFLMYYVANFKLTEFAKMLGKHQNISYIHIRALKKLREIMEGGKMNKSPDFETIQKANAGGSAAMQKLLTHYNAYNMLFAKYNGIINYVYAEEIKAKLMKPILKFDIDK